MTQYPRDILDTPDAFLALLGSFWTGYGGQQTATSVLAARSALERQTSMDLQRLFDGMDRRTVPLMTTRAGEVWTIRRSQTGQGYGQRTYGQGDVFDEDGPAVFGGAGLRRTFAWPLPTGVTTVAFVANRITHASRTLVRDVDFVIDGGYVVFRDDPFASPDFPADVVVEGGVEIDREILLWLGRVERDERLMSRQFGYALGLDRPSTQRFKDLVNAILDGITGGSTEMIVRRAWAAAAGLPVVLTDGETVEDVAVDVGVITVVTSANVYALPASSQPTVTVGQVLRAGDTLDDALEFFEPGSGDVPDPDFLPMLSLGDGFLAAGLFGELVFRNADVPLEAWREADGRTKVRFELGGWPADVDKFFDDAHDRPGVSIADALDLRPAGSRTEPAGPENLPATVNPLALLCRHFLRDNAVILRIRPESFPDGLDAEAAKLLRRVTPPQTAILVVGRLVVTERPVTMGGPGTETDPGCEENVSVFDGLSASDAIDPGTYVSESVRLIGIGGHCV